MAVEEHSEINLLSSIKRNMRWKFVVVLMITTVTTVLFTVLYWTHDDHSAVGLQWYQRLSLSDIYSANIVSAKSVSPRFEDEHLLAVDFYTCKSQPGLLKHNALENLTSYELRPSRVHLDVMKKMLVNRLTDDYCYCKRTIPLYSIPATPVNVTRSRCWWDNDGLLQCLPYFYIIGFSKCATTDMFSNLVWHPDILSTAKEPHWLDYLRFTDHRHHLQNYTKIFDGGIRKIEMRVFSRGYSTYIFGDGTPCTAWFAYKWPCFQGNLPHLGEPTYTNAHMVHKMNPNAKIIVMIRDPKERLYSRYLSWRQRLPHEAYQHPSPEAFHSLCVNAVKLYRECFQQRSPRQCAYNGTLYTQAVLRVQEGMYSVYLKDWLQLFSKNQVILVSFEQYTKFKVETVSAVWSFLGLEPAESKTMKKLKKKKPVNKNYLYQAIGLMLPKTRTLLDEFYKPFQTELDNLIQTGAFTLVKI